MKKKVLYALLSAVIAFGLWVYVITAVSPEWEETYYNIPVVLENESVLNDHGLMIAVDETPKVNLKLLGNRSDLANLNSSNITLIADLSKIYEAGEQRVGYSISYPGNIPSNSIEILSQTPKEITLTIAERKTKEVPVVVDYNGTTVPEGYRTDKENLILDYQFISVTGPAEVVDQIEEARIQVNLEGQTETISQSYHYTLCNKNAEAVDSEQVVTDVTEVRLTLEIQRYKEIQLKLDVISGGGATVRNSVIEMDMDTIQVSGSEQQLEDLGDELLLGEIKLGEVPEDTTLEFKIKLPEGVENLTGKSTVTVSVKFPNLITKTLLVSEFEAKNIPEGMNVEILTMEMEVNIRGPKVQIEALTAEDLSVYVDFSAAELGTDSYKALLYVDSGTFSSVGAVGPYYVYAKVTEATGKS